MSTTHKIMTSTSTATATASKNAPESKLAAIVDLARTHLNEQELQHLFRTIGLKISPEDTANVFTNYFLPLFPLDERKSIIDKLASLPYKYTLEPCAKAYFIDGLSKKQDEVVYGYLSKQGDGTKMQLLTKVLKEMTPEGLVTLINKSIRDKGLVPMQERLELAVDITRSLPYQQQAIAMQQVLKECPDQNKPLFAVKLLETLPDFTLDAGGDVDMAKELLSSGFNLENTAKIVVSGLNSLAQKLMQATKEIPGLDDEKRSVVDNEMVKFAKHVAVLSMDVGRCLEMVSSGGMNGGVIDLFTMPPTPESTPATPTRSPLKRQASSPPLHPGAGLSKSPKKQARATAPNRIAPTTPATDKHYWGSSIVTRDSTHPDTYNSFSTTTTTTKKPPSDPHGRPTDMRHPNFLYYHIAEELEVQKGKQDNGYSKVLGRSVKARQVSDAEGGKNGDANANAKGKGRNKSVAASKMLGKGVEEDKEELRNPAAAVAALPTPPAPTNTTATIPQLFEFKQTINPALLQLPLAPQEVRVDTTADTTCGIKMEEEPNPFDASFFTRMWRVELVEPDAADGDHEWFVISKEGTAVRKFI